MPLKRLSISKKLIIITSGITAFTLTVGFIFLLVGYVQSLKDNLAETMIQNAKLVSQYSYIPMHFEDEDQSMESLSWLTSIPSVHKAVIFDTLGNRFVYYHADNKSNIPEIEFSEDNQVFDQDYLHLFKPMVYKDRKYGIIYLIVSTEYLTENINASILFIVTLLIVLLSFTIFLAVIFQKSVTKPIIDLAEVMDEVTEREDYSFRMENERNDEIGVLYNDFNAMLNKIESGQNELIESSEKFSAVVENSNDAIVILQNGIIKYVNPAVKRFSGFDPQHLLDKKFINFVHHNNKKLVRGLISSVKNNKGELQLYEVELEKKDKSFLMAEISVTSIEYLDQKSVMVFIRDITQRKKAELEKNKLEEQIRRAQKMETIGRLAGGIAHDFNNILTPIIGYANMAMPKLKKSDPFKVYFEAILKASERAKDLVQQILTFSRQVESDPKPLELDLIIKETLQLIRPSLPTSIEIKQKIDEKCHKILADGTQIHQVIMNLCTNAYYAMKKKGGVLGIELKEVIIDKKTADFSVSMKTGTYAQISISDSGVGIEPDMLEYIFEPFFTTKKVGEGTGLGLSVVHGIVRSYNGDIVVYSEPGKGSVFHVYLPIMEDMEKLKKAKSGTEKNVLTGNEKILVVDDEEAIAQMLKLMLIDLGYKVVEKTSSKDALNEYKKHPNQYDLILTDLTMPNMSGLDLAREVQKIQKNMPIILTTGYSEPVSSEIKKQLNIKSLLAKPVINNELARAIRNALD